MQGDFQIRKPRRGFFVAALISGPALALVAWWGSTSPSTVESVYSRGIYPWIADFLARVFPPLPFPAAEVLVIFGVVGILFVGIRGLIRLVKPDASSPRRDFLKRLGLWARRALAVASVVVAFFLAAWGFNYQRLSWAENNGWKAPGGTVADLGSLVDRLADDATRLRALLPQASDGTALPLGGGRWDSTSLRERIAAAYRKASVDYPLLRLDAPPPKDLWFSEVFSWLGISGIFLPFTGEPFVNAGPEGASLAFTAAHEMAHERGWAREDEANFLAYLVLSQSGEADLEYSADLMALLYSFDALASTGERGESIRAGSMKRIGGAVIRDWKSYFAYWRRFQGPLEKAAERINDVYLKTQGQKDGVQSYGRMVDLLLAYEARP